MDDRQQPTVAALGLTIDELAQRVGMTVRNLREWKTLGLLPAAEVHGRVGYYPESVADRILVIQRLHAQGFTLELIRRLLETSGDLGDEVMRFAGAMREPFHDRDGPVLDPEDWAAKGGSTEPGDLERARELGLIRRRPDGQLEFTSARVARVGETLLALGLSTDELLEATAHIRARADEIAERFEQVWLDHVWQPFLDAGRPPSELPRLQETLAAVQPLALDAVVALFTVAMETRIEQSIAREVERAPTRRPRQRRRRS